MKLYEFEGLNILKKVGINVPEFAVCSDLEEVEQAQKRFKFPIVAKVQVLLGKRGKSGGVVVCRSTKQLTDFAKMHLGEDFPPAGGGDKVQFIVLAQMVDIKEENYISISYDTVLAVPFLMFSKKGGVDIEEISHDDTGSLVRVDIDALVGPRSSVILSKAKNLGFAGDKFVDAALRLWDAFVKYDCRLVEVNPLALTGDREYVAVDAKVILDDSGLIRHTDLDVLPKGAISALPTKRELETKKIDASDYRGSAGSTFIELPGDIAILASGGGASLLVMDSVAAAGGECANYTEYSGNPPSEKVEKLTEIALAKDGLSGCLVAGAVANFTDIYETLNGFAKGLEKVTPKPDYPILIRRGGPRQKEAYEMLSALAKKEGYDMHLFGPETPISVACRKMVELSEQYKSKLRQRHSGEPA